MRRTVIALMTASALSFASYAVHAGGGHGGGQGHGGGHSGGHGYGGHGYGGGHGHGFHGGLFLDFGHFFPDYYYPPRIYSYSERYEPPVYIEREREQSYWYYCSDPEGYHPYIEECPGGWEREVPRPPSSLRNRNDR